MARWSKKDQRQYEHIKDSAEDRGRGTGRAKELAARTVNKRRRQEGRASNSRSGRSAGGLEDNTKQDLYDRAKKLGIEGRSKMNKSDLVKAIRRHG